MKVLVTGASGFVGRRLCAALVSAGHSVVAPVRISGSRAPMPSGVEVCQVTDPLDAVILTPLLAGAGAVIHLAARVHVMREGAADPIAEYNRINVEGTRAVAVAARASGVRHLLFISSIKVNGEGRETPYSEDDPPRPTDPYAQSKLAAEAVVQSFTSEPASTILRPPLVYGPGVGGNFRRLLQLASAASRWPLPLGGIDSLRSMIFVDNLADAIVTAIRDPAARNKTFLVSDDHDIGVSELLGRLAIALGGRPRLFRAPMPLLQLAGSLLGREADLARILGTLRINGGLIHTTLGWRPPFALDDGLGITARWWRSTK